MSNQTYSEYLSQIDAWRKNRDEVLRAPDGWLSLTNLFILSEGTFTIGSNPANAILLPESAPAYLGALEFKNNRATLHVSADVPVLANGVPVHIVDLEDNTNKQPTLVTVGTAIFFIHHFADQYAVRVKDTANPARQSFTGNEWFEVKPEYRVQGQFTRYEEVQPLPIDTIHHYPSVYKSAGEIAFELNGQSLKLLAADYGLGGQLTIAFRDATSGKQTYGPVRFLQVNVGTDGQVDVDFNKAVNPPCAFTPFATCPLAPKENVLSVPIEAGELYGQPVKDIYNYFEAQLSALQPA